ncbi:hypothetical protein HK096_002786 [Nowakowskiella sp. JEL0078]|nr:hypothetical protein HK096_002786 [Nowakowskiella sp. JEL0078]
MLPVYVIIRNSKVFRLSYPQISARRWKFRKPEVHLYLKTDVDGLGETGSKNYLGEIVAVDTVRARKFLVPFGLAYYVPRTKFQPVLPDDWEPKMNTADFPSMLVPAFGFEIEQLTNLGNAEKEASGSTTNISLALIEELKKISILEFQRMRVTEDSDRIFGSVSVDDVLEELSGITNANFEKSQVKMEKIKTLGSFKIEIEVGNQEPVIVTIVVKEGMLQQVCQAGLQHDGLSILPLGLKMNMEYCLPRHFVPLTKINATLKLQTETLKTAGGAHANVSPIFDHFKLY